MSEETEKEAMMEDEIKISPDNLKDLEKNISELATIISNDSEIGGRIQEVIEYHLKEGIDFETYERVGSSLVNFVGEGAARLILNYLYNDDIFKIIQKRIESENVSKVLPFLQYLTAIYGIKMKEAYTLFGENPNDWRNVKSTAYCESGGDVWFIDVNLTKYSGETFFLKMSPPSAFHLVRNLLSEMENVPKEVVGEDTIENFRKETEGFRKKFLNDTTGGD